MVSICVDKDTDVDGENGEQNTGQGYSCKLVDKLDAKENNGAHHNEKYSPVDPKIIEFD